MGEWCFDLVENGLTACAQHSKIASVFRWDGKVENEVEWRIQCKTDAPRKQPLVDEIHSNPPNDIPLIICLESNSTIDYSARVGKK